MESWQLRLLGGASLARGADVLPRLDRRVAALLAYLALEGETPRSRLAELLFPDAETSTARNNLVHVLRRLKRGVNAELVTGTRTLNVAPHVVTDLRDGAGELLAGYEFGDLPDFEDWLLACRERLREDRAERLRHAAAALEGEGALDEAKALARELLDLDVVDEDAWRSLMRLAFLGGDRAEALRVYRRCKETLQRELGVPPSPETEALAHRIGTGDGPSTPRGTARIPLSVLRPPVLVGREREWAVMEAARHAHQIIAVVGEAGSGKSRLLRDFAMSKGRPFVFECRPSDAEVFAANERFFRALLAAHPDVTLPPWVTRELARVLPELGEPPAALASEEDKVVHALALAETLRAVIRAGTTLFVFDDVHFYDDASAEVCMMAWSHLGWGERDAEFELWFAARRADFTDRLVRFTTTLVEARRLVLVELEPLLEADVDVLLASLGIPHLTEHATALRRVVGGNPQFLLETVKSLVESGSLEEGAPAVLAVPRRIGEVIEARLARLPQAALHVARAAAVLRSDFGPELVSETLAVPLMDVALSWEDLEAAQVFAGERFAHDLVLETVQATTPPTVSALLHRSAARVLAKHGVPAARVARHWEAGGDARSAATWFGRAADDAARAYRVTQAAGFRERASDLYASVGDADKAFDELYAAMRLLVDVSYHPDLERLGRRLEAIAVTPSQRARTLEPRLHRLFEQGNFVELERASHEALRAATQARDDRLQAVFHEALGTVGLLTGREDMTVWHLSEMARLAEVLGDVGLGAVTQIGLGRLAAPKRHREAIEHFQRARTLYQATPDAMGIVSALVKEALVWNALGSHKESLRCVEEAREVLDGSDVASYYRLQWAHSAFWALHSVGRDDEARRVLSDALVVDGAEQAWWHGILRLDLAAWHLARGEVEAADREVRLVEAREDLPPLDVGLRLFARACVDAARRQDARSAFERALAHVGDTLPFLRANILVEWAAVSGGAEAQAFLAEARALCEAYDFRALRERIDARTERV
ncbi:BTAD domain-containing putative transcriptional regulator [Deinococcus yavapaiensis]|uniref:DNA-binding SARP family transcriptional activator n=1 Tax=Deinococcus yavapaiensis KR-236 TaxID=694435 RepID=A0A318RZM7_9DEIO|nr:BTAD domain-containing putative transcriptional regulator [Deinococcus yavapaiensis]PYE49398.1 DNA-binding SARP family transcriptional activator [Deinococcus yavapaiensis KR-236]